ncbi:MoxR family ATPase [Bacillus aquiflavi]|uniref:MoxR family ATPase n=1 Tax=Bacillus aquiflavi TaxID=2672567 RepID=A0A6B3VYB6_9BACI|nr:MoxR family ATPase [Bacillus aquiflavi]MBA4536193.1 MoxR family ATPase [Bacillus aquiflavi]NEY80561.1 MoxR family ATPase [Bacillus aquiflavi]
MSDINEIERKFIAGAEKMANVRQEIKKFIVGQEEVIDQVLWSIFSGGHALLEGLPGLGKTMLIKTISESLSLAFSRIQFTPDLMPADITGTMILQPDEQGRQRFKFHEGPLFSNIVLADEINRATPKTQSALLEAMGERTVTVMGKTKKMLTPFFVLATQNPIDLEGTYPLPEAQLDRFMSKIHVEYPTAEQLKEIALRTTGTEQIKLTEVIDGKEVVAIQQLCKEVLISSEILTLAVAIICATQPRSDDAPQSVKQFVQYGSGPRGLQSLIHMAKTRALFSGRYHVSIGDIKHVARPVLRHRLILNFEGEASGISPDTIIEEAIASVRKQGAAI